MRQDTVGMRLQFLQRQRRHERPSGDVLAGDLQRPFSVGGLCGNALLRRPDRAERSLGVPAVIRRGGGLLQALGGASGGFTSGRKEIIELLRQRSRPYLFSNTLAPPIVYGSMAVFDLLSKTTELRDKLEWNTKYFREKMTEAGFDIKPGVHPIVPIMLYNAKLSQDMARDLYAEGIYVIGFYYPVVPKGQARIRVQLSAGHEFEHVDKAIDAFTRIGRKYDILGKTKDEIIEKYGL